MRSGRKTRFGRIHRQFLVYWKEYSDPDWVDAADLNCGAQLLDFDRNSASRNRFEVMQSYDEGLQNIQSYDCLREVEPVRCCCIEMVEVM